MPIRVLSFDFDGSLYNSQYDQNETLSVVEANKKFLDGLARENDSFSKVVTMVGSNRQDFTTNMTNGGMGQRKACFPHFLEITKYLHQQTNLNRSEPINVTEDRFLLADAYGISGKSLSPGTSMAQMLEKKSLDNIASWVFDESKLTILYAQMHKIASENPNEEIVYDFYDDTDSIHRRLIEFFQKPGHEHMIPKNVKLRIHKYDGGEAALLREFQGKGPVDRTYIQTTVNMGRKIARLDHEGPIPNGKFYTTKLDDTALMVCGAVGLSAYRTLPGQIDKEYVEFKETYKTTIPSVCAEKLFTDHLSYASWIVVRPSDSRSPGTAITYFDDKTNTVQHYDYKDGRLFKKDNVEPLSLAESKMIADQIANKEVAAVGGQQVFNIRAELYRPYYHEMTRQQAEKHVQFNSHNAVLRKSETKPGFEVITLLGDNRQCCHCFLKQGALYTNQNGKMALMTPEVSQIWMEMLGKKQILGGADPDINKLVTYNLVNTKTHFHGIQSDVTELQKDLKKISTSKALAKEFAYESFNIIDYESLNSFMEKTAKVMAEAYAKQLGQSGQGHSRVLENLLVALGDKKLGAKDKRIIEVVKDLAMYELTTSSKKYGISDTDKHKLDLAHFSQNLINLSTKGQGKTEQAKIDARNQVIIKIIDHRHKSLKDQNSKGGMDIAKIAELNFWEVLKQVSEGLSKEGKPLKLSEMIQDERVQGVLQKHQQDLSQRYKGESTGFRKGQENELTKQMRKLIEAYPKGDQHDQMEAVEIAFGKK